MNNPFSYQNDLTGFRNTIQSQTSRHDALIQQAQSRALGKKRELIQRAKDVKAAGEELVKQGLEGAAIPHAGKAIYRGGKAVYNALRGGTKSAAQQEPEAEDLDGRVNITQVNNTSSGAPESNVTADQEVRTGTRFGEIDEADLTGSAPFTRPSVPRPTPSEGTANPDVGRGFGDIDESELTRSAPFTRSQRPQITEQVSNAEEQASDNAARLSSNLEDQARSGVSQVTEGAENAENAVNDALSAGRNATQNALSSVSEGAEEASQGLSNAISSASSGVEDLTSGLSSGLEEGLSTGISALSDATAATSWIPFVGEVLGGVTAAAALGAAGYGLYEEIVGGDQEQKAEDTIVKPQAVPKLNVAGAFIAPQQTSVET